MCDKSDYTFIYFCCCVTLSVVVLVIVWLVKVNLEARKKLDEKKNKLTYFFAMKAKTVTEVWETSASDTNATWYNNPPIQLPSTNDTLVFINIWQCDVENSSVRFVTQNRSVFDRERARLHTEGIPYSAAIMGRFNGYSTEPSILWSLDKSVSRSLEEVHEEMIGTKTQYKGAPYVYAGYAHYQINIFIYKSNPAQYKALKNYLLVNN
jgi:hypothetical protein